MNYKGVMKRIGNTSLTINLNAIQATSKDEADYSDFLTLANNVFLVDIEEPTYCGNLKPPKIISENSYLIWDTE